MELCSGMTEGLSSAASSPSQRHRDRSSSVMVLGYALGVVGQDVDHPAVSDPATPALLHHALELGLEHDQAGDPRLHFPQMSPGNSVRLLARSVRIIAQLQQFADSVQGKSEFPAMADEGEPVRVYFPVKSLIS